MNVMLTRLLSLLLCGALLLAAPPPAMAEGGDLTPEEQALWDEWDQAEDTQAGEGNTGALSPEDEAALEALEAAMASGSMDEVDLSNLEPNERLPGNVFNILLLGVDNRKEELAHGLSDAIIICSVNLDTGSVKLTSIARDTAVIIPGLKSQNRVNMAYRKGPERAMKTINRNFHMNIQRYVVVNIHGLADIIDALGGIDLDMTSKEAGRINYELRKEPMDKVKREKVEARDGLQHLDGMQAVTFARIRNIDSDLERTRRQRQLLETLLKKVMADGMDIGKFVTLVETALPYGDTNLTFAEMMQLGQAVLKGGTMESLENGGTALEEFRIPIDKLWTYKTFNGNDLIYISEKRMEQTIETLHEFIYGEAYLRD